MTLARIETIDDFALAVQLMRAGAWGLYLGLGLTVLLFLLALLGVWRRDERLVHAARRGQYALLLVAAFCTGLLALGIFDGYYFVKYIRAVTENAETTPFKISAIWASQQGSLLFWCLILTLSGAAYAFTQRHNRTDRRLPWALAALAAVEFFFFFIMCSPESFERSNPFAFEYGWMADPEAGWSAVKLSSLSLETINLRADLLELVWLARENGLGELTFAELQARILSNPAGLPAPVQGWLLESVRDGNGMNPALHNYWIAIHPPMLYLGYVGFTIPFVYAVGALASGEVGEGWLRPIRLWTMTAWLFLTVGIAMGGLWAYEILGWGGYWAWDPVENASFIPWLTGTAFLHSVIVSERRGMMKVWTFALVIVTYCMTVVGTFLVRSGIINSVHAFGDTGVKGPFYFFMLAIFLGSILLLVWRSPLLKSERKFESLISREATFLFNNLILTAIAAATLVITFWPWITEQLYGETGKQELGADAYNMINGPLFLVMLFLTGVGPVLGWRRNTPKQLLRNFLMPAGAGLLVLVGNLGVLTRNEMLIATDSPETVTRLASWGKLAAQIFLLPICAFTLMTVVQEFLTGAQARRKSTGQGWLSALAGVTFANRRRYGGYVVHVGLLMVAAGIYFSSFYDTEGSVVTPPGGFAVLDDRFLVYYDGAERTDWWDMTSELSRRDEQALMIYSNVLAEVREHPDQSAEEILEQMNRKFIDPETGEPLKIPAEARARMAAAVVWGVSMRDNPSVYEKYESTVRIFPYEPETRDAKPFLAAHSELMRLSFDTRAMETDADTWEQQVLAALADVSETGVALGPELPAVLREVREGLATLPDDRFVALFSLPKGIGAADMELSRATIERRLEALHGEIERAVIERRAEKVQELALALPSESAQAELSAMRPLSLQGLRSALEIAPEAQRAPIEAEIEAILADAGVVHPSMRIFYNKRDGMPRLNEPVKDPAIERRLGEDVYLILQNVEPDGTAYFRFFVKPKMLLGLAGLLVMVFGAVFAVLPGVRRRRPEPA